MNTNMHGGKSVAGGTDGGGGRRRSLWKGPALVTAIVLLIPLLGNCFVDGWNWDFRGFVLADTFVFGAGLTYEMVTRNRDKIAY
jgi:hypoxanthine-guanine phosphoribosyltransferase